MKNIYLHIGQPKTGTSALQEFFDANRVLIKDTCKTYYPEYQRNIYSGMGHQYFFSDFCLGTFYDLRTVIDKEQCDCVISDEFLTHSILSIQNYYFDSLKEIFQKYSIKIIMYIRRIDDQISLYTAS